MKPLKMRQSLAIIVVSLVLLYISGNALIDQLKDNEHKTDFSIITTDEDIELSQNSNYINAISAFNRKDYGVAIDELNEEIKKYSNHAQAYFLL